MHLANKKLFSLLSQRTMMQQSKTSQSSDVSTGFTSAASSFTFDLRKLHENQPAANMESFGFSNVPFSSPNQNSGQFLTNSSTFSSNEMSQTAFFGQPTVNYNLDVMSNQFQPQSQMNTCSFNVNYFDSDQQNEDNTCYSNLETLPPEILESFQARTFKIGNVPNVPPPKQACIS